MIEDTKVTRLLRPIVDSPLPHSMAKYARSMAKYARWDAREGQLLTQAELVESLASSWWWWYAPGFGVLRSLSRARTMSEEWLGA